MKPWQLGDGDNTVATEQLRMEFIFDSINRQLAAIGVTDQTTFDVFANYIGYSTGGTPSYQDMQVAWTPTNVDFPSHFQYSLFHDAGISDLQLLPTTVLGGGMDIEGTTSLVTLSWPNLVSATGTTCYFYMSNNSGLTTLSFPNVVTLENGITCSGNANLANVSMPNFLPTADSVINFFGGALNASSVDHILARCVANPAYNSGPLDLSGGTNSAPSSTAPGSDYAILVARGVTVTVNP